MEVTQRLADFIVSSKYEDIPKQAADMAKRCILDCLGVTIGASIEPISKIIRTYIEDQGGKPQSTVIGLNLKTSSSNAAFANGLLGHALDYDDLQMNFWGHPTVVTLPAALAIGEWIRASGKDLITALVLGIEAECKIGAAVNPSHYMKGWHNTATIGTFGAAVAAGRLLNLDSEQMACALGIAGSQSAGLKENFGTMTKPFHAGQAARNGTVAALLASKGFTGARNILEGKSGFCQVMSERYDLNKITENLGKSWDILDVIFKPYPCCGSIHPALDAMIFLAREHNINPEDVASVEVSTANPLALDEVSRPEPKTVNDARFSTEFCLAIALLDREVSLKQFAVEKLKDQQILRHARKVRLRVDPGIAKGDPRSKATIVKVKMKNAKGYARREDFARGWPQRPMSEKELVEKYARCVNLLLPKRKIDKSIDLIMELEKLDDINNLIEQLST